MDIYTILSLKEQLDDLDKKRIRLYNNIKKYCDEVMYAKRLYLYKIV